jgi:hypothetical protein
MKGSQKLSKPSSTDKSVNGITNSVAKTTIDESPRAKSKNLDVVAEYTKASKKNAVNFVVIGRDIYNRFQRPNLTIGRPRRCWQKHPHGPATV